MTAADGGVLFDAGVIPAAWLVTADDGWSGTLWGRGQTEAARDGGADRRPSSRWMPVAAATVVSLAGLLLAGLGGDHAGDCPLARRS
jgi:hypothetical protein